MAEQSIFYRDIETGWLLKCRPDYKIDKLVLDLKTAENASTSSIDRNFIKLGYHLQDAMYSFIADAEEFYFAVIESKPPFVITAPVELPLELKQQGFVDFRLGLRDLVYAFQNNEWKPYFEGLYTIQSKPWQVEPDVNEHYEQLQEEALHE